MDMIASNVRISDTIIYVARITAACTVLGPLSKHNAEKSTGWQIHFTFGSTGLNKQTKQANKKKVLVYKRTWKCPMSLRPFIIYLLPWLAAHWPNSTYFISLHWNSLLMFFKWIYLKIIYSRKKKDKKNTIRQTRMTSISEILILLHILCPENQAKPVIQQSFNQKKTKKWQKEVINPLQAATKCRLRGHRGGRCNEETRRYSVRCYMQNFTRD